MKILLKISFGLLALILIAVIGIAVTFNPNDYKKDIITLFKEHTGRQLSIPGDISLSFFPWIGIELGKINISNAKGFTKKTFAKMTHLQVRAKLWPLFQQRLEADTLVIEGLHLNLAINKKGQNNWEDLLQNKTTQAVTKKETSKSNNSQKTKTKLLAAFAINGLKIKNSQFNFHDQQLNQKTSIKDIQLELGQLKPNIPILLNGQFQLKQKDINAKINFGNEIVFSPDFKQLSFKNIKSNSKIKLKSIENEQRLKLASKLISLDLNQQTAKSEKLTISVNDAILNLNFLAKNISSKPNIKGLLKIETLNPQAIIKNLNIALPIMADKQALTKFNAKFNLSGSIENIALSNIEINLDDSQIKGNAIVKLPSSSSVNLNINKINVDRYLPPIPTKKDNKTTSAKKKPSLETALIPVALLTQVDLAANIKINELQIKKTHWEKLHLVTQAKQGTVNLNPIKLQGYGSTINSSLHIKAVKNDASLSAKLNIKNIKSGALLKDFMGVKNLQGLTSVKADIKTKGIKLTQLKQNLNGNAHFKLKEGIIKGFDLEHEINKLEAKIKGKATPTVPSPLQTKFTNLNASATIKNGIIHNKDLRAATPFTRIVGQGKINLLKEKLDYVATVKLTRSRDISSKKTFEKMNSIPLDVHIKGTFDKPQIKADFNKALKMLAKKELKKQEKKYKKKIESEKQKLKEKAKKELKKKLGDKLKNLFKF